MSTWITRADPHAAGPSGPRPAGHGGHGWMMIACCVPVLLIAFALVAAGVVSVGFLAAALACTAVMALMMRGMDHAGHGSTPAATSDQDTSAGAKES